MNKPVLAMLVLVGCSSFHSPFATGGSAHDPDWGKHPYGAFGNDCGDYQCPEGNACGNRIDLDNPFGYCKPGQCCPIPGFHDNDYGHTVPTCGMLGCR
jgi:hypothetical protein